MPPPPVEIKAGRPRDGRCLGLGSWYMLSGGDDICSGKAYAPVSPKYLSPFLLLPSLTTPVSTFLPSDPGVPQGPGFGLAGSPRKLLGLATPTLGIPSRGQDEKKKSYREDSRMFLPPALTSDFRLDPANQCLTSCQISPLRPA